MNCIQRWLARHGRAALTRDIARRLLWRMRCEAREAALAEVAAEVEAELRRLDDDGGGTT